ncbi:hypothetical protein K7X08_004075 [Anisodus acutangulus]|uniref:Uncharacterized protein n=1 Tax=Anisodus acutangulus TaxID=402998 RepID=A0A9Q1MGK6_9SOLA|nr:hypothetical protein K7X08_004075 [Anisodus acutangulus]
MERYFVGLPVKQEIQEEPATDPSGSSYYVTCWKCTTCYSKYNIYCISSSDNSQQSHPKSSVLKKLTLPVITYQLFLRLARHPWLGSWRSARKG